MSAYICPTCKNIAYTSKQYLAAGGCCLYCGRVLEASGEKNLASPPIQGGQPAAGRLALHHPRVNMLNGSNAEGKTGAQNNNQFTSPTSEVPEDELVALRIVPVKGDIREVDAIAQLLNSLGKVVTPISFEIAGTDRRRFLLVRCRKADAETVKGRITAIYGNPEIVELAPAEDPLANFKKNSYIGRTRLAVAKPAGLPLRTYRELGSNDTIMPVLAAMYDLKDDEVGIAQVIIHAEAPEDWAVPYKKELLAIKRRQQGLLTSGQLLKLFALIVGAGFLVIGLGMTFFKAWFVALLTGLLGGGLVYYGRGFFQQSDLEWSESQEEMVARKIQMPAYQVEIRLTVGSNDRVRTRRILASLAGAYKVFALESGNHLEPSPSSFSSSFTPLDMTQKPAQISLLGDEEIATLWHLPVEDLPDMLESSRVRHVLPDIEQVSEKDGGWFIGQAKKSAGVPVDVWLPREAITKTHALLMGRTRMGKSNTLEHMIHEVARDMERTIVVIDPHDDMVDDLLGLMPQNRLQDIIYLDFGAEDMRPGFNPLDVTLFDGDPEATASAFHEVAHSLYKRYWGPRMEVPFQRAVMAITLANSIREPDAQFTVLDVLAVLQFKSEQRINFLQEALPDSTLKRTIINYFNLEFGALQKAFREQVVMPVLSKLRPFESNTQLLSIFGQPRCTFNLVDAVLSGKIILIRTGAAKITKEYADFLGSLMLNMVRKAVFLQSNLRFEARRPVTIFVDESQSFSGVDFGEILAEVAKFGGNLVLTTQGSKTIGRSTASDQVDDPHAFSKIMDNVDTVFVFRMSGENATSLSDTEFWEETTPADLINLEKYAAFVRYSKGAKVVGPFKVFLDGPLDKDPFMAASIWREAQKYLRPTGELLETAERSLERITHYFHTEKSLGSRIHDGGVMLTQFDAAAAAEEMMNTVPDFGEGAGADFVCHALGDLNTEAPNEGKDHHTPPSGTAKRDKNWLDG